MYQAIILGLLGSLLPADVWRNSSQMAEAYGYLHEMHTVTTEDGYIISLFRIPGKKGESPAQLKKRVPLVVQPGIFCSSDNLLAAGPPYAPAFFFADRGMDVWLPNSRGTLYSLGHVNLTTNDRKYWNFSFHELGVYDQPAYIDYITKLTGFEKVHYVGHSQGGAQMFAAMSLHPEYYRRKLKSVVSLGGVTAFDTTRSVILRVIHAIHYLEISEFLGVYEFAWFNQLIGLTFATLNTFVPALARLVSEHFYDSYPEGGNSTGVTVFVGHYPQGGSTRGMQHLFQLMDNPGFCRYREQKHDPCQLYDLSKIPPVPIAIIGGEGDLMASPESQMWLHHELLKHGKKHFMRVYPIVGHLGLVTPSNGNTQHLFDIYDFFRSAEVDFF